MKKVGKYMLYLEKLKNFRPYKARLNTISGITNDTKTPKNGTVVVFIGSRPDSFPNFLKSGWLSRQNFKMVYRNRKFKTLNKRAQYNHSINTLYDDVSTKEIGFNYQTRNSIKTYGGKNVIYDLSEPYRLTVNSLTSKTNQAIEKSIWNLLNISLRQFTSNGYDNILVVSDIVSPYGKNSYLTATKNNYDFANLLYQSLRKGTVSYKGSMNLMLTNGDQNFIYAPLDLSQFNGSKAPSQLLMMIKNSIKKLVNLSDDEVEYGYDLGDDEVAVRNRANSQSDNSGGTQAAPTKMVIKDPKEPEVEENPDNEPEDSGEEIYQDNSKDRDKKESKVQSKVDDVMELLDLMGISYEIDDGISEQRVSGELDDKFKKELSKTLSSNSDLLKSSPSAIYDSIKRTPEFSSIISDYVNIQNIGKDGTQYATKIKNLEKAQNDIYESDEIQKKLDKVKNTKIEPKVFDDVDTIFEETKKESMVTAFDENYVNKQFDKDILEMFRAFNDTDAKLYLTKYDVESIDDNLDKLDRYSVSYSSAAGKRSSFSVDIPKVIDDRYIFFKGSKKIITKQITSKPLVKIAPTKVFISTNYNKMDIERVGEALNEFSVVLKKILTDSEFNKNGKVNVTLGQSVKANGSTVSLMYGTMSAYLFKLIGPNEVLYFNQRKIKEYIEDDGNLSQINYDSINEYPIGYNKNKSSIITESLTDNKIYEVTNDGKHTELESNLNRYVAGIIDNNTPYSISSTSIKANANLSFTRVRLANRRIPLIALLGYEFGLTNVLTRAGIDFYFDTKNVRRDLGDGYAKIRFNNGYLYYDANSVQASILLAGLRAMSTSDYDFIQFNDVIPYMDYFDDKLDSANLGKAIHNMVQLMIDPITKDVLSDLGLPTDMLGLLLEANNALSSGTYYLKNDMRQYRIRAVEQIPAVLYRQLAHAAEASMNRAGTPFSISRGSVLAELGTLQTVESASELNPSLTTDLAAKVSYKGLMGQNSDETYGNEIRAFDKSMMGIFAPTTPDSNKVGIVRFLSHGTNLKGTRGYMDINNPVNINTGTSSTVEMMTPFSSTNDDAPRLQMNSAQQKHIIPTKGSTKPMYGTGIEKSVHLSMPDGFIVKAKDDGKVEKVDEDHGLVVLKYNNGQKDVIDMSKRLYNNSAGGFYQNLDLTLMYKPGRKFKKGDIVAKNNDFFKGTDPKDLNYSVGTLSKIALSSSDGTYEDSTVITDKMSDMLESEFVNKREVLLDKSTKVLALAAEDENVKASDPLIVFEDGLDDADANDAMNAFAEFDDDDLEDLLSDSISRKKLAKHAGNIVKVNLYYNTPIDEMSPSLAKIVRKYENKNDAKIKVIQSELGDSPTHEYQNNVISGMESDPNRLNGQEASGVLIEWYIKSAEPMAVGDKINL